MTGFGIDVSARRILPSGWFTGLSYTGFFTDGSSSIGDPNTNSQSVLANLHDRSLANLILNTTFDDGVVDAAQETVEIKRHQGDLVLGREIRFLPWLGGSWHTGLRIAAIDVDRDVLYQDLSGANLLSAQTTLKSRMIGGGPTVGVASAFDMTGTGWMIKSGASASLLVSHFDLSRKDLQTTPTAAGFRNVEMTTYGMVPMLDATIELSKAFGNFQLGVGYRVSVAIGGARTILSIGNDDVDGTTSPYIVEKNDVINHGVFARAAMAFGPPVSRPVLDDAYTNGATIVFESKVYYAWGYLGGTPSYGTYANRAAGFIGGLPIVVAPSYNGDFASPGTMAGLGVELGARRILASGRFTGLSYTGFFTDDTSSTGALNNAGNAVLVNFLDRSLANLVVNGTFDNGEADTAQEAIKIKRHQGDLVLGRKTQLLPWLGGSWQAGLRAAAIEVDRDVLYQNLEGGTVRSAQTTLESRMIGAGPTIGVASAFDVMRTGWMIKSSASASLLVSHFDLSRNDLQLGAASAGFRNVDMSNYGVVPMLDATIELSKAFGNFQLGVGYRVSAALGGARTILTIGGDDVDGATSPYLIEKNDIINHGVFAKAGMVFGPAH